MHSNPQTHRAMRARTQPGGQPSSTTGAAKQLINLPFAGFYNSIFDDAFNRVLEMHALSMAEDGKEGCWEIDVWQDGLVGATDWSTAATAVATKYVEHLSSFLKEELDIDLTLEFASLRSPREYNFETDRINAHAQLAQLQTLYELASSMTLSNLIAERHSSYPGFISFYSNDMGDWIAQPIGQWDQNQLCTLLMAAMKDAGIDEDWECKVLEQMEEAGVIGAALDAAIDWDKANDAVRQKTIANRMRTGMA